MAIIAIGLKLLSAKVGVVWQFVRRPEAEPRTNLIVRYCSFMQQAHDGFLWYKIRSRCEFPRSLLFFFRQKACLMMELQSIGFSLLLVVTTVLAQYGEFSFWISHFMIGRCIG